MTVITMAKNNNNKQYALSLKELYQLSQKSSEPLVQYTGQAMMHVLGGNPPKIKNIGVLISQRLETLEVLTREDQFLMRSLERKMKMSIQQYAEALNKFS